MVQKAPGIPRGAATLSRLRIFLLRSSSKLVYCEPAMS